MLIRRLFFSLGGFTALKHLLGHPENVPEAVRQVQNEMSDHMLAHWMLVNIRAYIPTTNQAICLAVGLGGAALVYQYYHHSGDEPSSAQAPQTPQSKSPRPHS